jgi:hypothetical protein
MWNIIISTIVFVFSAWYIRRLLDEHGLPKGMTRGLLVFVLAYMVSWASGEVVDWAREQMFGPEPESQTQKDLTELLKASGITPP